MDTEDDIPTISTNISSNVSQYELSLPSTSHAIVHSTPISVGHVLSYEDNET